jgi:hypothetical protein
VLRGRLGSRRGIFGRRYLFLTFTSRLDVTLVDRALIATPLFFMVRHFHLRLLSLRGLFVTFFNGGLGIFVGRNAVAHFNNDKLVRLCVINNYFYTRIPTNGKLH